MITRYHPVMSFDRSQSDLDSVTITMAPNDRGAYVRYDEYRMTIDALVKELKFLDSELNKMKEHFDVAR